MPPRPLRSARFSGRPLTASTTPGDHPTLAGSVINPALSVNRYWTLTAAGLVFTDYDIALAWVGSDVDPGASSAAFVVAKLTGGTWTAPNVRSARRLRSQLAD